ncbi:MAG: AsmA family protein [Rhodovibrio sp.]|nr:AsmA family protein [Rhodovibrio sp.]
MKKLIYALLAVLFVLVAAVLLLPSLIDWNAYKDQLAQQVERATGRDITVDGPVSLSLLPSPAFSAQQVTLANVDGGRDQPMARIADLRVRVALAPLLQGQVEVEQLVLVEPQLLLERTPDGRANWRFGDAAGKSAGPSGNDGRASLDTGLLGQVSLQNVRVVDGTLRFIDPAAGIDRRFTALDARLSAQALSGPFEAEGSLESTGIPLEFDGQLGRLGGGGPAPYSLRVQLSGTDAHADLGGALSTGDALRLQGDLELRGGDLATVLAQITGRAAADYPAQLAQTFSAESRLTLEGGVLKAQDLSLQLGDTGADGRLQVTFPAASGARQTEAVADLTVQRLDLDRLLAMQRENADPAGGSGRSGDAGDSFSLPQDLRAELNVNVGAILYRDRVIRQGRANAVLADGTVTLNQAMALLPGSSDLAVFGTLAAQDGKPVFDGRLESASDNLRGMLAWLGIDAERVPADRLRRMELLADLQARPGQITLTNIDLDVDTAQLKGGIAIALRQRPGFGIGLTADRLNLDAYLPTDQAASDGSDGGDGSSDDGGSDDGGPPLGWLGGFDANFDLRAGQLTYAGTTAQDVKLDATLHNQALTVREASVGNLAGAAVRVDGKLSDLVGLDPQLDLNIDLDVENLPRFAGAFGLGDGVPAGLGPVALVGTAQGGVANAKVDGTLAALGGTATFQGTVEPLAAPAAFDLVLALQHDSLRTLSEQVPGLKALPPETGPLDLTAQVAGTSRSFGTDNLKGRIGPVQLSGPFSVDLAGARPKVTASFETGDLPLAAFAGASAGTSGSGSDTRDSGAEPAGDGDSTGSGTRWSAQPLPLDALTTFDLDLTVTSEALVLPDGSRLEGAEMAGTLSDGVLDLDRLTGTLFGGEVSASGTLDVRDTAAASLMIDARQVSSAPLLARAFGLQALDGPIDLKADLNAKGASPNAMIESLAGEGEVSGRVTVAPELFLGPQAGRLLDRNGAGDGRLGQQLSNMLGDAFGAGVKIRGLTQALDFVGTAFTQKRARLTGSFAVAEGIVTTSDLTLDGLDGRAETRGQVNLPTWRLQMTTELFRAKDAPDDPFVVTRQTGPLDAPDVAITGGAFQQQLTPEKIQEETQDTAPGADAADGNDADAGGGTEDAPSPDDPEGDDAQQPDDGGGSANGSGGGQPKRAEEIIRGVLDQLQSDQ